MKKQVSKFVYWTPRILSILFLLFLAMFSLDVFSPGMSFWQIVVGLFMHNIPVFVLLIILIISWKHEIVGGVTFILAGLAYIAWVFASGWEWFKISSSIVTIAGPAFLIGILFIIGWLKKRK
jgi:hypothetical protein